ncbi:MAG: cytochrome b/b6 domain-containing protein [Betaproteobacteria bacterium]|nr:cytochrome b/b6 domain-containing protein [Betaproteobacteria bacterium]
MAKSETAASGETAWVKIHPLVVRITHWINALAVLVMVASGLRIHNAEPILPFKFANEITLGAGLAGAIQWHFAAMWLLAANGLAYLIYGFVSGHFRRKLWPVRPAEVLADVLAAFKGKLSHQDLSHYNAAQRAAYLVVIICIIVLVFSGLAIWKPVQFQELTATFGGFDSARIVHFVAMALLTAVVLVHIVMVLLVPKTFPAMITGRTRMIS